MPGRLKKSFGEAKRVGSTPKLKKAGGMLGK